MPFARNDPDLTNRIAQAVGQLRGRQIRGFGELPPEVQLAEVTMDEPMLRVDGPRFSGTMRLTVASVRAGANERSPIATLFGDFMGVLVDAWPHITLASLDLDGDAPAPLAPDALRDSFVPIAGGRA